MRVQESSQPKRRGGRSFSLWAGSGLVGLVCFLLAWGVEHTLNRAEFYPLIALQGVVYDRGMTLHARRALERREGGPVAVLEITERTRELLGDVPGFFPGGPERASFQDADQERLFHARVVDNLRRAGARVVAFDLLFDEEKPGDPELARALREHGRTVLAVLDERGTVGGGQAEVLHNWQYPVPALREAAAGLGVALVPRDDPEPTVRRFSWWFQGIDDDAEDILLPSLGVAAAALYADHDPKTVIEEEVKPRQRFLGRRVQWTEAPGWEGPLSYLRYYGVTGAPAGRESVVAYEDVFLLGTGGDASQAAHEERVRERLRDRVILIGDATRVGQDYHQVPVASPAAGGGSTRQMPGVEIHAQAIQTALAGAYPRRASESAHVLLLLASCLTVALLGRLLMPFPLAISCGLLFAGLWWGSVRLLSDAGVWLEPVTASMGLLTTFFGELAFMYFAERRQRLLVRRQLSRHVGPGVADTLAEEHWPEFGGEARSITMFFSDLQGFTSLSETMSSQEICRLLNAYFGVIFPVVFRYGGAVDKVMGDGLMAYFGWPDRSADHAERAVRCAVEMQEALDAWQALPENAGLPPLRTRIGIHTGEATVGEIGHGERAEFTVIGDIVNVASRLEGMNKEFGTTILVSEATREAAGEIVPMVYRGAAAVRGKKEPMPVYSVERTPPAGEVRR